MQQLNAFDCGMYAVTSAIDLANNIDPTNRSYETQNIRYHLSRCFESYILSFETPLPLPNAFLLF